MGSSVVSYLEAVELADMNLSELSSLAQQSIASVPSCGGIGGIIDLSSSSSSFKGHPLQVRRKQDWGRGFILLLPQAAALPESDAGSGVIKPASSFVIQNRQT